VILSIIMPRQNIHDQTHTTTETNEMDA